MNDLILSFGLFVFLPCLVMCISNRLFLLNGLLFGYQKHSNCCLIVPRTNRVPHACLVRFKLLVYKIESNNLI